MACIPGMPCFGPVKGPVYPEGMGPCTIPCVDAQYIIYEGPNLPCTGINTSTNLQVALEKIDEKVCPENILTSILLLLQTDPTFKATFCSIVNSCLPTTTTTTTLP
jgi:hypothetical protein